jgi:DNA-binding NarL/FixJ family response regulator
MKILIVDDNAGIRRLLRRALDEVASDLWECSDGAQTLAAYADRQPDVVLMDIRMPDMDGLAATRQIRHIYPSAKVVMVTDYDDYDLRIAAAEAGACGYTLKQNYTVGQYGSYLQSLAYQPPFANTLTLGNTLDKVQQNGLPPFYDSLFGLANAIGIQSGDGNYAVNRNYRLPYSQFWA